MPALEAVKQSAGIFIALAMGATVSQDVPVNGPSSTMEPSSIALRKHRTDCAGCN